MTRLEFASLLSYVPRAGGGDLGDQSRDLMHILKEGRLTGTPPVSMSDRVASELERNTSIRDAFGEFLNPSVVLVPVPGASHFKPESLWVPNELAVALVKRGFGSRVATLVYRTRVVPKAAFSRAEDRLPAIGQYSSMAVQKDLKPVTSFTLIDDIVTRGDTSLGAANRLIDAYPNTPVRVFAGMRTISNPTEFEKVRSPCTGWITLQADGHCLRRP